MKKEISFTNNSSLLRLRRGLRHSVSAAMLASAMMAGVGINAYAADDLIVDSDTVTIDSPQTAASVYVYHGGVINGTSTLTAEVEFSLNDGSISANLAGDVDLNKNSTGTIYLSGSNTYTGTTNVNAGTLVIGDGVNGSIEGGLVTVSGDATLKLNLGNGSTFANDIFLETGGPGFGSLYSISSGTTTISGVISGLGGVMVNSPGNDETAHLILTGENTFTGFMGAEHGTLQIGDGVSGSISSNVGVYTYADTGYLLLNLADGGVFSNEVDNNGSFGFGASGVNTVSGVISGSGAIGNVGTGLTILTGSNTYEGGTYVLSGTLQVGDGSTVGASIHDSVGVSVYEGAAFVIKQTDGEWFSNRIATYGTVHSVVGDGTTNYLDGQITGGGGFVKEGAGTLVFENSWDEDPDFDTQHGYSGDTVIKEGTLRMGQDWALSHRSSTIIEAGATLDLDNTDQEVAMISGSGTLHTGWAQRDLWVGGYGYDGEVLPQLSGAFYGDIIGDADIYKDGDGVWALYGDSPDYNGTIYVENGVLGFFGNFGGNGIIEVGENATLIGNGYVDNAVINYGRFYLANDRFAPSTFTAGYSYAQDFNGTLITPVSSSKNYGRLVVGGTAYLDGTLALVPVNGYQAKRSDKLTVLTAGGGLDGRFSEFESFLPETMLNAKVVYKSNSVVIEFEQGKFGDLKGLTANEKAVGKALDRVNTKKSFNSLFDELNVIPLDEVPDVLALLSPEQYAAIFNIGFATSQVQFNNLERRLSDVRNGATGFSSNGLALTNSRGTLNYNGAPIVNERDGLSLAGFDGKSIVGKQTVAPIITESRWSFFVTGQGEWADVENTKNALGSEFSTGGVTVGADYRVSENFVVGLSANYTNTGSDLNNGGEITVNSGRGAVYATVFGGGFYGNAVVGGGYNSYDLKRATFGGKAHADTDGGQFDALLGGGYDYKVGGFTVGPVASLQYTYLGLSGFSENGSSAPLVFGSQNQDSLKSTLGLKASYAFNVGGVKITPEVRAQWLHEYLDSTAAVESSFAAGGSAFTVNGPNIGRDGLLLDAGLSAQFTDSFSVFAYYTGEYGRTNYSSNSVNGGFRISF